MPTARASSATEMQIIQSLGIGACTERDCQRTPAIAMSDDCDSAAVRHPISPAPLEPPGNQ